jgi:hypothetical protein
MSEAIAVAEQIADKPVNTVPAIGQPWPGVDGKYYGVARGEIGEPDHHIVLLNAQPLGRLPWKKAVEWAHGLGDGASLPTRFESALLYANGQAEVDNGKWHWTSTQSSDANAWLQNFSYGYQYADDKSYGGWARAVRRFPLNPSVL